MNTNSNIYTVIYSAVLVIVVAAILAFASEALKGKQNENVKLETITKVLTAASQADEAYNITSDTDILGDYSKFVTAAYYVDCDGNKVGELNLGKENLKDIQVASTSYLKGQNDIIKKIEAGNADAKKDLKLPVYEFDINGDAVTVIPCYGAGLWGPVWGYLAFASDGRTFEGAIFDHKSETPGLGAKIAEEPFYTQFKGHTLTDDCSFAVVKGGAHGDPNGVDAISGASITSQAVGKTINTWVKYYRPLLDKGAQTKATETECAETAAVADSTACCPAQVDSTVVK